MSTSQASNVKLKLIALLKHPKAKLSKAHLPTLRSFTTHACVFTVIMSVIAYFYHLPDGSNISTLVTTNASAQQHGSSIDDATALQIAGKIADQSDLPVAKNIANLSISIDTENKISQGDSEAISKPQIIEPTANSRSIKKYIAKDGDTIQSIAELHAVSTQTIKWANNLTADTVEPGTDVTVPPVDGVIYTTKDGDTIDTIASKYKSDSAQIVSFNDLELSGIKSNQQIILPKGELPQEEQPGYVAPVQSSLSSISPSGASPAGSSGTSQLVNGYTPINMTTAGNAYAFGNCTSWAYERRTQLGHPIGSYWGNAATWDTLGRAAGYVVDKTPTVGAVYQMPAFIDAYTGVYGHVGIVESVNPDGSIYISEMNYAGNFNRVTYRTIPAAQAALYNYIH